MKRDQLITFIIVLVPDLVLAWLAMSFGNGDQSTFWYALAGLVAVESFFSLKSTLAASLAFRLYGRKRLTAGAGQFLRANEFPASHGEEGIDSYFDRIAQSEAFPIHLRLIAASEQAKLQQLEQQAIFPVLRVRSAYEAALREHHAPEPVGI